MFNLEVDVSRVPQVVRLSGELTIYEARELHETLTKALADGQQWDLDLESVTEIDTAGIQVFMVAVRDLLGRGGGMQVTEAPESVRSTFAVLNLEAMFSMQASSAPTAV